MIHPSLHDGGEVYGGSVDDTGTVELMPAVDNVRYRIIQADINNVGPIFIRLHRTDSAVINKGIVLWPGDFHEIIYANMYEGPIRGICAPATTEMFYGHDGR